MNFTRREKEVLAGLAQGKTLREITEDMYPGKPKAIKRVEELCAKIKDKVEDANPGKKMNMHKLIVYAVYYVYAIEPFYRTLGETVTAKFSDLTQKGVANSSTP